VNPRAEADENDLSARNDLLTGLGLDPILLEAGLLEESLDIAQKFADRIDPARIPCVSYWNHDRRNMAEGNRI
jgi:UDP-sulfoquinovose synthase